MKSLIDRLTTELTSQGWEMNGELCFHRDLGTHSIYKAAIIQRNENLRQGRWLVFWMAVISMALLGASYLF